jgi:hypothetical protein
MPVSGVELVAWSAGAGRGPSAPKADVAGGEVAPFGRHHVLHRRRPGHSDPQVVVDPPIKSQGLLPVYDAEPAPSDVD